MKTSLISKAAGAGTALVVSVLLANSGLAGPGSQYWQQQQKLRSENAAKNQETTPATKPAETHGMACPNCKSSLVTEYSATNVSGKFAPHFTPVGSRHQCAACGGEVVTIHGKTSNSMKANCPICAKPKTAATTCCN